MDKRIIEFIRALRASGVRVSLAEAQDALNGIQQVGAENREYFRQTLRTTVVKDQRNQRAFDYFFPLFFTANRPPMENIPDNLSGDDKQTLKDALQSLMGDMGALQQLLRQLLQGQPFSQDQLDQMAQQAGMRPGADMSDRRQMERRMRQRSQLSSQQLQEAIEQLLQELEAMGMGSEQIDQIR